MMREEGEAAALEVGVHGIHPELIRLLGKNEVPYQLWSERIEAFYRSGTVVRSVSRGNRRGYPYGKTCRFIT